MKTISFIAAASDSGKTTLIEKLIPLLKARGLTVAVVKHAPKGFDPERPGKDTWRFREAGADAVAVAGPGGVTTMPGTDRKTSAEELERLVGGCDIVLREGFKSAGGDRIEVFRAGASANRPLCLDDRGIIAVVSDTRIEAGIPCFSLDDAEGVAAFIAAKLQL